MDHRKVVDKNVIRTDCFKIMKSGTVEYGLKTNRKTFTTLMRRCVGSLTTARRKFIRHNMSKDCIRQLQNMTMRYVERCLKQGCFTNQKVVKQSGVTIWSWDQASKWWTVSEFPGLLEMNSPFCSAHIYGRNIRRHRWCQFRLDENNIVLLAQKLREQSTATG